MRAALVLATLATAVAPPSAGAETRAFEIAVGPTGIDDLASARQLIPADTTQAATTLAASRVIYLNKNGITLTPGDNDSRSNKSTLVKVPTVIPAWATSDATWTATVACMRELFAPFDVTIVTSDP